MIENSTIARINSTVAVCALAAACSQAPPPADQTPVDPTPGLYAITLSGAGLLKVAGKDDKPKNYCLRASEASAFPYMLPENYYALHYSCAKTRAPREGNAIAGEINCSVDPKMAQGMSRFSYAGVVAPEKVTVKVGMKLDAAIKEGAMSDAEAAQLKAGAKLMERMRFIIEATRVGDC